MAMARRYRPRTTRRTGGRPAGGRPGPVSWLVPGLVSGLMSWLVILALLAQAAATGSWRPPPVPAGAADSLVASHRNPGTGEPPAAGPRASRPGGESRHASHVPHAMHGSQHAPAAAQDAGFRDGEQTPAPAEPHQPTGPHCLGCPNFLPQVLPAFAAAIPLRMDIAAGEAALPAERAPASRPHRTPNHPRAPPPLLT